MALVEVRVCDCGAESFEDEPAWLWWRWASLAVVEVSFCDCFKDKGL